MNFLWIDKMADNVMALVKKKGPQKKLRGKAAQRQKARSAATARPKHVPDKRTPFRSFIYMDPSEMIEEIDSFVARAGWTQDRQAPDYRGPRDGPDVQHPQDRHTVPPRQDVLRRL